MNIDLKIVFGLFLTCLIFGASTIWIVSRHPEKHQVITQAYPTGKPPPEQLGTNQEPDAQALHIKNNKPRAPHVFMYRSIEYNALLNQEYTLKFKAKAKDIKPCSVNLSIRPDWVSVATLPSGTYDYKEVKVKFVPMSSSVIIYVISEDVGEIWLKDFDLHPTK